MLLIAPLLAFAQGTEYSQPAFDPDHHGNSFMPVETIDTFSGALMLSYTDIVLPGPNGFDLEIVRWYNSKINRWDPSCTIRQREKTSLGVGWQMHMGRLWDNPVTTQPRPAYRLELPGGRQEAFYGDNVLNIPNATWVSSGGWSLRDAACVGAPGTCKVATSPAGIEYHFPTSFDYRMDPDDSFLYVRTIRDPIDNRITVTYDYSCNCNQAYIDTVTDTFGRVVKFHYVDAENVPGTCSFDNASCFSDADCQDYCADEFVPCSFDTQCGNFICSDDGSPCTTAANCDRNCSNNNNPCATDAQCGGSTCVGGPDNGDPCSGSADCGGTCLGGGNPGASCTSSSNCTGLCQGGFDAGDPCTSDAWCDGICLGGGNAGAECSSADACYGICQGGDDAGDPCDFSGDCDGICQGGGNPGTPCTSSSTCTDICQGGSNPGAACTSDASCNGICQAGSNPGDPCTQNSQCGGICQGGQNQGDDCINNGQCHSVCSNSLSPCNNNSQCIPPGVCNIGQCVLGACAKGTCNQGICNSGTCSQGVCSDGDCVKGTCIKGTCPPAPVCLPQPGCISTGDCVEAICTSTALRSLDKITLEWVTGTVTYQYYVDETQIDSPVLQSFQTPTGLTTTYDHTPAPGDQGFDLELKKITLATGGMIEYAYVDHQFYTPLHATGQGMECTRVVTEKKIGNDVWTYDYPTGHPTDKTTVVIDPLGHRREYTYARYSNNGPDKLWRVGLLESMRVKEGSTVLLEEQYTYEPFQYSFDNAAPYPHFEFAQVSRMVERRVTHRSLKTQRTIWSGHDYYNNVGFVEEHGFDDVLYRKTEYAYEHSNGDSDDATFAAAHIVDRVSSVVTKSAAGVKRAETKIEYDANSTGGNAFGNPDNEQRWTGSAYMTMSYEYDTHGQPSRITLSGGGVTRITDLLHEYGSLSRVQTNGKVILDRTIDENSSLIVGERNAQNALTSFNYDGWGQLTTIDPPLGDTTSIVYEAQVVTVTKGPGESQYTYDDFGRLVTTRTRLNAGVYAYKKLDYDVVGNVERQYEASTLSNSTPATVYSYDAMGRITSANRVDGTTSLTYGADTTTINDGVLTRVITRDAFGRIKSVQEAGDTTSYGYDELDNLTSVDHPGSTSNRTFVYNAMGWLESETHPESGTTTHHYNGVGDVDWKQDADGDVIFFEYDTQGRMTRINRPSPEVDVYFYYDGQTVPGHTATYSNGIDELTGMTDETGSTVWADRDVLGRAIRTEKKLEGVIYETEYEFDTHGNLASIDYPAAPQASRTSVDYTYNHANLVDTITLNGTSPLVNSILYNPELQPATIELGNDVTIHIPTSPALRNRPDWIFTVGVTLNGSDADLELDYSYNSRGQVSGIITNGRSDTYTYHPKGYLNRVTYGGQGYVDHSYDQNGNMTQRYSPAFPAQQFTRVYADKNRIIGGFVYSGSGNPTVASGHAYTYTPDNRLRSVDGTVNYAYDGEGRLVKTAIPGQNKRFVDLHEDVLGRLTRFTGGTTGSLQPERDWIYAAGMLIATVDHGSPTDQTGNLHLRETSNQAELFWSGTAQTCPLRYKVDRAANTLPGNFVTLTDPPISGNSYVDTGVLGNNNDYFYLVESQEPAVCWYVSDHRGSTRLVLDGQGEVLASYEYFPFAGIKQGSSCGELEGVYQNMHRDPVVDLYDFGARHYGQAFARFLTPDTVLPDQLMPSLWNLYAYAGNDPINLLDVDGFAVTTAHGGVNHLRDIDLGSDGRGWRNIAEIAINTVAGSVSDYTSYDTIVDGVALAGNSEYSTSERIWGATKAVVAGLSTFGGGGPLNALKGSGTSLVTGAVKLADEAADAAKALRRLGSGAANALPEGTVAARGATRLADDAANVGRRAPDFVVTPRGEAIPVPTGATGPYPTRGPGFQYTGGAGGPGLDPAVSNVRIMDPTSRYPGGYVNYSNASVPPQSVNPFTGQTIAPSDPMWHIPLQP